MLDPTNDGELIPLNQVRNALAWLPRVHPSTIHRWVTRGARAANGERVRLEALRIGEQLYTSAPAVQRFLERLNRSDEPAPAPRPTADQVSARVARARARLERAGVRRPAMGSA